MSRSVAKVANCYTLLVSSISFILFYFKRDKKLETIDISNNNCGNITNLICQTSCLKPNEDGVWRIYTWFCIFRLRWGSILCVLLMANNKEVNGPRTAIRYERRIFVLVSSWTISLAHTADHDGTMGRSWAELGWANMWQWHSDELLWPYQSVSNYHYDSDTTIWCVNSPTNSFKNITRTI